jgi:hypothetical protein
MVLMRSSSSWLKLLGSTKRGPDMRSEAGGEDLEDVVLWLNPLLVVEASDNGESTDKGFLLIDCCESLGSISTLATLGLVWWDGGLAASDIPEAVRFLRYCDGVRGRPNSG